MRYASIDVLRTVAIALMILVHFLENLSGVTWAPAGLGAPLFAFLSGLNIRIWTLSLEAKGITDEAIRRIAVRRGLFLFVLGIAFNVLVWLPSDTFNWDVLTMIGTAMVALAFLRGLPSGFLAFVCAVVFVLSPFLRIQADYASHWTNGYFESETTLPDVLIGYLSTGYFPLFPWIIFPIVGYIAGSYLFHRPTDGEATPRSVRPLVTYGVCFLAISVFLRVIRDALPDPIPTKLVMGWTMFPASPEYVTGVLGIALVSFGILHVGIDRRDCLRRVPAILNVTRTMSQYSLTVYLLHHILHLWPLWIYGTLFGTEATEFWHSAMPVAVSGPLALGCFAACSVLFRQMRRREWPSVESLMRWLCD